MPLVSNITAFIKVLSTPYSTRENLHTLKWICQSRRQMSILSKGSFLSPYPKPAGRKVALPLFPLQKSLDKVWGSPTAGVLVGGNHLSAPHSSCPFTLIGIKTNPDVIYCFPITHASFFPHPIWLVKFIKVTIQVENSLHSQFWRIHMDGEQHYP